MLHSYFYYTESPAKCKHNPYFGLDIAKFQIFGYNTGDHVKGGDAVLVIKHRDILPGEGHAAGRSLLKEMVESISHAPMPKILIGSRGKPYFETGDLHFSITHTKHHVFCAVSDRPIGIDAEELDREVPVKLLPRILSPFEISQYESATHQPLALLKLWVLKEAYFKYLGTGINGWPNHTNFSVDDPRVTQLHGCLLAVVQEDTYAL
jgi:phosphopantetheinyl transferase